MSAHHYFRDFAYCDSGIIPWLVVWEYLSTCNISLSDLISVQKNQFPSSGELIFLDAAKCAENEFNIILHQRQSSIDDSMACR